MCLGLILFLAPLKQVYPKYPNLVIAQPNSNLPWNRIKPRKLEKYRFNINISMIKSLVGKGVEYTLTDYMLLSWDCLTIVKCRLSNGRQVHTQRIHFGFSVLISPFGLEEEQNYIFLEEQ